MKCEYCGVEFTPIRKGQVNCSAKCRDRKHHNISKKSISIDCESLKKCEWCEKEYKPIQYRSRFCSRKCNIAEYNFRTGRSKNDVRKEEEKICIICGNTFKDNSKSRCKKYCSNYCKNRSNTLKKYPNAKKQEEVHSQALINKAEKERQKAEALKIYQEKQKHIQEQRRIQKEQEYKEKHPVIECIVCGEKFERPQPNQICCSKECMKKHRNQISHKRKRYEGITQDSGISLFKLAARDNNQCQICGLYVDWNDKIESNDTIICGDMYPSIDHIKPISRKGMHSWSNIQLAHRKCNYIKSNKYIG